MKEIAEIVGLTTGIINLLLLFVALRKISVVHKVINSRLDKWLAVEREQGEASGRAKEREEKK